MSDEQGFWSWPWGKKEDVAEEEVPMREAYGVTVDADDDQWTALTGDATRDLSPMTQFRMREIARYLWETTPLGNWLIETPIDFLLAEGVKLSCDDEEANSWLAAFWDDPINRMDITLEDKVRELSLYGEQCWVAFVNEANGHMRLGYLNPGLIQTVVRDPDNKAQPIGIVTSKDKKGKALRYRIIINGDEDVFTRRTQQIRKSFSDGDCFFFKINSLCEGQHGRSDLLPVADWLDSYEQFMFGDSDRAQMQGAFIWDVKMTGATQAEVEARAKQIGRPSSGSVRVHNENEEWSAPSPSGNSADTSNTARMQRNHIMGGRAMPEHWFGGGGDVNRATASEMDMPTMKRLKRRQRFVKYMLEEVGTYQLLQRLSHTNKAFDPVTMKVKAEMPELVASDVTKFAAALQQIATSVVMLINANIIDNETALEFIERIADEMDVDIDCAELLLEIKDKASRKKEADVFTEPPAAKEAEQA